MRLITTLLLACLAFPASAAISFVNGCEASAANGGNVTLTLPTLLVNDLVIVVAAIGDNDNLDFNMAMSTAGYTEVVDVAVANDVQDVDMAVYWKVMGSTPDTSAVFTGQGGADASVAAVCLCFRGVSTSTPMDVTATSITGINTMHPDPPSIDWVTAGTWTVIAGASGHILTGTGTYTFPTGYTVNPRDIGADDTSDVTAGAGYNTAPADPENPGVMTHSGVDSADAAWAAATLALREAPPVTCTPAMTLFGVGNGC